MTATAATPEMVGAARPADAGPPPGADAVLAAARTHLAPTTALLDPDRTGGRPHVLAAARHARRRLDDDRARTRDPSMEVLLHAAGTDQIDEALDRVGLAGDVTSVALVLLEPDDGVDAFLAEAGLARDPDVLAPDPDRALEVARARGHDPDPDDALEWLIEDCALVALG